MIYQKYSKLFEACTGHVDSRHKLHQLQRNTDETSQGAFCPRRPSGRLLIVEAPERGQSCAQCGTMRTITLTGPASSAATLGFRQRPPQTQITQPHVSCFIL